MEYLGRRTVTTVESFENDGMIEIKVKVVQERSVDGIDWESKSIESSAISEDISRAYALALAPLNTELESHAYDLFEESVEEKEDGYNLLQ